MARNYQTKTNKDDNPDSFTGTKSGAHEYNSPRDEITNLVTASDLVPSPYNVDPAGTLPLVEDRYQAAQAVFIASISGQSFSDSGSSSTYNLTPVRTSFVLPPAGTDPGEGYNTIAGAMISFIANSTCGTAPDLDFGPVGGPSYGAKPIKTDETVPQSLAALDIIAGTRYQVYYDPGEDAWILVQALAVRRSVSTFIHYEQPSGTGGGKILDAEVNTWKQMKLNTVHLNELGISIDTVLNTFTLPPGNYRIMGFGICDDRHSARIRLYDVTNTQAKSYSLNGGISSFAAPLLDNPYIFLLDKISVASTATFRLEIYATGGVEEDGNLGGPCSIVGVPERYTILEINRD
jgi:hypothetical protein